MPAPSVNGRTAAEGIAELLCAKGIKRVYGLCGGHIQPLWDAVSRAGIQVVAVRHECAAIYMAHAEAQLTGGPGVALVTAGPGLTNAVTGVANAHVSGVPVLVLSGRPPRLQDGMGAMQEIPQAELMAPICRRVAVVSEVRHALARVEDALQYAMGRDGLPGPVYVDFSTDVLWERLTPIDWNPLYFRPLARPEFLAPASVLEAAAGLLRRARRPLVLAGRGAWGATPEIVEFLDTTGALYLDTVESRGVVPADHPGGVPTLRSRALSEADTVITLGRRMNYQVGYGSEAVFSAGPRFLRIGRSVEETSWNRPGDVEVQADVRAVLERLVQIGAVPGSPDAAWSEDMRKTNREKMRQLEQRLAEWPDGKDGRMHPYRMLHAVNRLVDADTIVVADGGDILSFARVALKYHGRYLDCGPYGCLGVGVPFAIAAKLIEPGRRVVSVIGDGSFGFTAMEVETAVRVGAAAVFVIANNDAWNIERMDQVATYGGNVVGVDLHPCRYDLVARGLGAYGERVETSADLPAALDRALANAPAVVDVAVTGDAVSPDFKSGLAEVPHYQPLRSWDEAERKRRGGLQT